MKISHRQIRLILRILHCHGAFFGIFVFIYELFIQHSKSYTICYICYLIVTGTVLYLLFARKRPNSQFAYGTFYAMCFVTVLFFLSYIYESATIVSGMTNELIGHIEQNKELNPSIVVMIKLSKLV
jgi:bacteriorhodopsin